MTFDEFKKFYEEKGYLPNDVEKRKNKLNETQLKTRFKKYEKTLERTEYTKDIEWEELKENLDFSECFLIKRLKEEQMYDEFYELQNNAGCLLKTIDPAHVFPKGGYPYLKYDLENVVPLNRYSHSCLDTMRDPISGEPIDKEKHELFWMFIVGIERFIELKRKIEEYDKSR